METNIREIRKKRNLTLKELAEITGISIGYLSHLEKGTRDNPTITTLSVIANALNVEVGEIIKDK